MTNTEMHDLWESRTEDHHARLCHLEAAVFPLEPGRAPYSVDAEHKDTVEQGGHEMHVHTSAGIYALPMNKETADRLGVPTHLLERAPLSGGDFQVFLPVDVTATGNICNGKDHQAPARLAGLYLWQAFELVGAPYPHDDKFPSPKYSPDYLCGRCRVDMNTNPETLGQRARRLASLEVVAPLRQDVNHLLLVEESNSQRTRMRGFNGRPEIQRAWEQVHDGLSLIEHQLVQDELLHRGTVIYSTQIIGEREIERAKAGKKAAPGA